MPGLLYVVATPIGNLEDMTFRAVRVLKEANLIACEDTRQTRKLLEHYDIHTPLVSYHEFNESERSQELAARLLAGDTIALVSDAGVPLVSDPGYRLVRAAVENGIPVQPVPGPSAALAALSASGLPTDAFHFAGFLPAKAGQRAHALSALAEEEATLIFFEAPHRIIEALEAIEATLGPRPVAVARELTKVHEEIYRGLISQSVAHFSSQAPRGEITLVVAGKTQAEKWSGGQIESEVRQRLASGNSPAQVAGELGACSGWRRRELYRLIMEIQAAEDRGLLEDGHES